MHEVFMRFQQERGLSQREIGRLSDTCWACHGVIIDMLGEVQHLGDAEISVQAKGLVQQIQSCQFVANLCLFCRILSTTYGVSMAQQSSTINISESGRLITSMITSMS